MFNSLQRRFPALYLLTFAALLALLCWALRIAFPAEGELPTLSAMAFVAATALSFFPVLESLQLERVLRPDPPLWRCRAAILHGYYFFVVTRLVGDEPFPSDMAIAHMIGTAVYGAGMVWVARDDFSRRWLAEGGATLYDTDRPVWATRIGDLRLRLSAFVLIGIALFVSTVDLQSTAHAMVLLILAGGLMRSYPMRNLTKWRERDALGIVLIACLLTGLLTARTP